MKNLLLILALFSMAFVACNNESTDSGDATDTDNTTDVVDTDVINNDNTGAEDPAPTGPFATMEFDSYDHDFGQVTEGDVVEETFVFTNTGETDLIISNARGSCGCTVPYYPKEPIAPGETGEIKIQYNSKGKKGIQRKNVTITANTNPSTTTLNISSEVIPNPDAPAEDPAS